MKLVPFTPAIDFSWSKLQTVDGGARGQILFGVEDDAKAGTGAIIVHQPAGNVGESAPAARWYRVRS